MPKTITILLTLLALSFGGNMFIGGLWLGNQMQTHSEAAAPRVQHAPTALPAPAGISPREKMPIHRPHTGRLLLGAAFEDLPDELRRQFQQTLHQNGGKLRRALADEKTARDDALNALQAEPFDPDALAHALSAIRTAEGERRAIAHEAALSLINELAPEQRQAMHRKLSRSLLAPRHRRHSPRSFDRNPPANEDHRNIPLSDR